MPQFESPEEVLTHHDSFLPPSFDYYLVLCDAEMARDLLTFNIEAVVGITGSNRKKSARRITHHYSPQMVDEQWTLNPQPVVFSWNEAMSRWEMIDGQQRLHGIIEADKKKPGIQIPLVICIGAPLDAKEVIDHNKARTSSDTFAMSGAANAPALASAARMQFLYQNTLDGIEPYHSLEQWRKRAVPIRTLKAVVEANPQLVQGIGIAWEARAVVPVAAGAVLWYQIAKTNDPFVATQVIQALATGADISTDNPLRIVREYLNQRKVPGAKRRDSYEVLASILKAYNWWLLYESTGWLNAEGKKFTPYFTKAQKFPVILRRDVALKVAEDMAEERELAGVAA